MALGIDIAAAILIIVLAVVGYRRDVRRGIAALGGTLLGTTLVDFWGSRWGEQLAEWFGGGNPQTFTLVVSIFTFLLAVFLVGYGGGMFLGTSKDKPNSSRRMIGALLGALNGALVTGYILRFVTNNDPNFQNVQEAIVGRILVEGLPWLFLAFTVAVAIGVTVRLAMQLTAGTTQPKPKTQVPPQKPMRPAAPPPPAQRTTPPTTPPTMRPPQSPPPGTPQNQPQKPMNNPTQKP
ncbi:MAG: CvpA family protein [Chloroflexota bacterium]